MHAWDDAKAGNPDSDPAWRGDFKGLIQKLDYIKALGFSAIWITPVVQNASGYDYHGYHAINFAKVDPRYESAGASYQDLINAAHAKGLKIIQDIVVNHTGNFGEENLFPMFKKDPTKPDTANNLVKITDKLPSNYDTMTPDQQYQARIALMKTAETNNNIYHTEKAYPGNPTRFRQDKSQATAWT
ncbi:alpha-amylase family glycosyl hydrolase [Paenibacillus hexagrammi]|uniref:alpha-amylase family glycosyl hydrolase n=1 Tax=Paenibacillus hexagrammi TaxID=2908839 RepID=UPI003312F9EA